MSENMRTFLKFLRFDLYEDLVFSCMKYLGVAGMSYMWAYVFFMCSSDVIVRMNIPGDISVFDCAFYILSGMGSGTTVGMALMFMLIRLMLALIIGEHILKSMKRHGQQMIMQSGAKIRWWLGKCVWAVCVTAGYYLCIFAGIAVLAGSKGYVWKVSLNTELLRHMYSIQPNGFNQELVWLTILVPFIASVSICLLQMLITLMSNQIAAFLSVAAIYGLSACFASPLLIGNHSMTLRIYEITGTGIPFMQTILIDAALILLLVIAGGIYLRRKDMHDIHNIRIISEELSELAYQRYQYYYMQL